jgi:2-phosphosulfolactate phosphatase
VTASFARTVDVVLTADALVPARLGGATALVIDVLRASTTITTALAHGAAGIIAVADVDDARGRATALGPAALLAGERGGDAPPGFDLGNSPLEFTRDRVAGRLIVMTTSNGTRALAAARHAAAVGVAAFVNASAAVSWAVRQDRDVVLICSGELGRPSLEDQACAGWLAGLLEKEGATLTPAAAEARTLAADYASDPGRLAADAPHARALIAKGRADDVAACLTLDVFALVPVRSADVDKLVLASP